MATDTVAHPSDAAVAGQKLLHARAQDQLEARVLLCRFHQHGQELGLRQHRDEGETGRKAAEVQQREVLTVDPQGGLSEFAVRQGEDPFGQSKIVENFQDRRVDRVPAEISVEIPMLLQQRDAQTGTGEQQGEHRTRGATADDAAVHAVAARGRRRSREGRHDRIRWVARPAWRRWIG